MPLEESDLLMKFEIKDNSYVTGEATTSLPSKGLAKDFEIGKMFEVASFSLSANLDDDDNEGDEDEKKKKKAREKAAARHGGKAKPTSRGGFLKWRRGEKSRYPVDMQPVSFKRAIDAGSTTLMQNCINRVVYKSASLIKRKPAGGPAAGEVYLRFDFISVMMIKFDIDNDEPIMEDYQFVCRGFKMYYKPQLPDGSLGGIIPCWYHTAPDVREPQI